MQIFFLIWISGKQYKSTDFCMYLFSFYFCHASAWARCNKERWIYPIEAKDLMGAIYCWHWSCLGIMLWFLFVKWTILLCTTEYLILDWRCVFVRGCVWLLVHFRSVSFSAVCGRDEHTQRHTSVQPYWLANRGDQWRFSRGRDCTASTDLRDRCNECMLLHTRMNTSMSHNL